MVRLGEQFLLLILEMLLCRVGLFCIDVQKLGSEVREMAQGKVLADQPGNPSPIPGTRGTDLTHCCGMHEPACAFPLGPYSWGDGLVC